MEVIRELTSEEIIKTLEQGLVTEHVKNRLERKEEYIRLGLDTSDFVTGFEVDKGHVGGNEYHIITPTGLIKIYNKNSKRLITILGARGGQIWRYFAQLDLLPMPNRIFRLVQSCYRREETNPIHHK